MKKILIVLSLIPVTIVIVGLTKYNIELNRFVKQDFIKKEKSNTKQNVNKTEIHVVGTVHFETDSIKRHNLYNYLDSISPSVILYEGDSSTVRRIVKKIDYFARFMDAFNSGKRVEKPVTLKYLKNNPKCILLPYEWELRNKFHRKHNLRKISKKLLNAVINLYRNNQLTKKQSASIKKFLELNNADTKTFNEGTIYDINSATSDSIIRQRQHYVYKVIPEIAKQRTELVEYLDFIPIHMSYWDTRNKAMVQNILKQVQHNPNKVIVVLNGYNHHYYLIDELKKYEAEYNFSTKGI